MQTTRQQSNLDELSPDYLDNNHIMHKTVINATIVKTKHTLLASTVWLKWIMKL